jgi:hypothetical protein
MGHLNVTCNTSPHTENENHPRIRLPSHRQSHWSMCVNPRSLSSPYRGVGANIKHPPFRLALGFRSAKSRRLPQKKQPDGCREVRPCRAHKQRVDALSAPRHPLKVCGVLPFFFFFFLRWWVRTSAPPTTDHNFLFRAICTQQVRRCCHDFFSVAPIIAARGFVGRSVQFCPFAPLESANAPPPPPPTPKKSVSSAARRPFHKRLGLVSNLRDRGCWISMRACGCLQAMFFFQPHLHEASSNCS